VFHSNTESAAALARWLECGSTTHQFSGAAGRPGVVAPLVIREESHAATTRRWHVDGLALSRNEAPQRQADDYTAIDWLCGD
jgi:hypothetical protein